MKFILMSREEELKNKETMEEIKSPVYLSIGVAVHCSW